ncbi:MAG TPA: RNA-binding protein [Labilithrix sp.]|nr:RNA-binding protein [Labilithrix sp.]
MTNKLYVSNVPIDSTEAALRSHFAACGGVADVELVFDPRSGKPRGLAYVTMTSPAFASAALRQLDGAVFGGASLHVSDSPIRAGDRAAPKVKIVQQFRERANMTYDLDCEGALR